MQLSQPLSNYFRFIGLLNEVTLNQDQLLKGSLNDDGNFRLTVDSSEVEVIFTVVDGQDFNLTVLEHRRGWINETLIPVPDSATVEELRTIRDRLISMLLNGIPEA